MAEFLTKLALNKMKELEHTKDKARSQSKRLAKKRVHRLNKFIASNIVHRKELT